MIKLRLIFALLALFTISKAQTEIIKSLKDFGAKGDGKTNDMPAFIKATEFFNDRHGNGTLIIPEGTYLVHTQTVNTKKDAAFYIKKDCFEFNNCQNLTIIGKGNPLIKFTEGQRFGSFHPKTGETFHPKMPFLDVKYRISIGNVFLLEKCTNIKIEGIESDGNIAKMLIGGTWGDVDYQVGHCGIVISNSYNIDIKNTKFHHFGLDGVLIMNEERFQNKQKIKDEISIKNSEFEYNGRQGLSWVGGFGLEVSGSKFNHTGRNGAISSKPGAGIDIEQETSPIWDGKFVNCEFINNTGVGLIAERGQSQDMQFYNCTFWGTTNFSMWTRKQNYVFKNSKFYGSIVHANDGKTEYDATKFYNCEFENNPYKDGNVFGRFLVEFNFVERVYFEYCTFNARNGVVPIWSDSAEKEGKTANLFKFCSINLFVDNSKKYEYPSVLRNVSFENTNFTVSIKKKDALKMMSFHPVYTLKLKKSKIVFADKQEFEVK